MNVWRRWNAATETWRTGLILGVATTVIIWCVWYFTKIPCTLDNALIIPCNPGGLARFINAEILTLALGSGIAVATLKGGYDTYMLKNMLNQEREARLQFEQRAEEDRQQLQEYISELRDELREAREERRQANEERQRQVAEERQRFVAEQRQVAEERNQSIVIQQAMLDAIVRLAQRPNGNGNQE